MIPLYCLRATRRACRYLFAIPALLAAALTVHAADFDPQRMAPDRDWTVIVSPYVWAASLNGNASLAGFDTDVDVPFSDTLRHLDLAAMGNIELTNGQWGVYLDGQYVRTSQDEQLQSHEIGIDIRMSSLAAGVYYKAYEELLGGDTVFGKPRTFSIEPTIGLRWTKLEADVSAFGLKADKSTDWTDPFVGVRFNGDLDERWNLVGAVDVGGFDVGSKLSVNAQAYLGYRTEMLGHSTILRGGYRMLYQDYENDDFTGANKFRWDVNQHGPVLGFSMLF